VRHVGSTLGVHNRQAGGVCGKDAGLLPPTAVRSSHYGINIITNDSFISCNQAELLGDSLGYQHSIKGHSLASSDRVGLFSNPVQPETNQFTG